ncbi:hypothetical protein NDU88_002715 [Pleurodeles waltl]|uniref:Uncharacterized protein n=1 Tax=Pleurodeles waltl TaxID=8319 RepID=A0AAV7L489_PLEWA|nr:hypothetical protein NDU88_002715 [Pleurodeles waltl]
MEYKPQGSRSWPSARYLLKREQNNCRLRKSRVPSQRAHGRRAQSRKWPKLPCASREALRIMRQPAVYGKQVNNVEPTR